MKTQLPSAIILCALLLVLSLHAFAAGNQTTHEVKCFNERFAKETTDGLS